MASLGQAILTLSVKDAEFSKGMGRAQQRAQKLQAGFLKVGAGLTAIGAGFIATAKVGADFQTAMNQVAAVSGATEEQFLQLNLQAKELGKTTQFSAKQAAEAMGFLAQAGFEADEVLGAMPGTLELAAAAQLDLADAADIVSNVMSGYALEVEDLSRINDVLVKTFTSSNTDLRQLGEAMKFAGPIASAAGISFESAAAAIGIMGNAGIQAGMAGTSLRGAISRLLNPTNKASLAMERMGLDVLDATGQLIPLNEIIKQLEPNADQVGDMMLIFGQRAGPAMAALASQGSDALIELEEKLLDAGGTAEEIADVQMQGLNGAMKALGSAFEGLQIAIAESGLLETFENIILWVTEVIQGMADMDPTLLKIIAGFGLLAAVLGPVLIALGLIIPPIVSLVAVITGSAGLMAVITGVVAILSGPVGIVIAIGAAVAALVYFLTTNETIRDSLKAAWDQIKKNFEFTWAAIKAVFEFAIKPILELISGFTGKVTDLFSQLKKAVVGNSIIPEMMDEIDDEFGRLSKPIGRNAQRDLDKIEGMFSAFRVEVVNAGEDTMDGFSLPFEQLRTTLKPTVGRDLNSFSDLFKDFKQEVIVEAGESMDGFSLALARMGTDIKPKLATDLVGFGDLYKDFGDVVVTEGEDAVDAWGFSLGKMGKDVKALTPIVAAETTLMGKSFHDLEVGVGDLVGIFQGKDGVVGLDGAIKGIFSGDILNGLGNVAGKIKDLFSGDILSGLGSLWDSFKSGITSIGDLAIELPKLITTIVGFVGDVISGIGGFLGKLFGGGGAAAGGGGGGGAVGAGATIGTMILPGIGTAIGAAVGGIVELLAGGDDKGRDIEENTRFSYINLAILIGVQHETNATLWSVHGAIGDTATSTQSVLWTIRTTIYNARIAIVNKLGDLIRGTTDALVDISNAVVPTSDPTTGPIALPWWMTPLPKPGPIALPWWMTPLPKPEPLLVGGGLVPDISPRRGSDIKISIQAFDGADVERAVRTKIAPALQRLRANRMI